MRCGRLLRRCRPPYVQLIFSLSSSFYLVRSTNLITATVKEIENWVPGPGCDGINIYCRGKHDTPVKRAEEITPGRRDDGRQPRWPRPCGVKPIPGCIDIDFEPPSERAKETDPKSVIDIEAAVHQTQDLVTVEDTGASSPAKRTEGSMFPLWCSQIPNTRSPCFLSQRSTDGDILILNERVELQPLPPQCHDVDYAVIPCLTGPPQAGKIWIAEKYPGQAPPDPIPDAFPQTQHVAAIEDTEEIKDVVSVRRSEELLHPMWCKHIFITRPPCLLSQRSADGHILILEERFDLKSLPPDCHRLEESVLPCTWLTSLGVPWVVDKYDGEVALHSTLDREDVVPQIQSIAAVEGKEEIKAITRVRREEEDTARSPYCIHERVEGCIICGDLIPCFPPYFRWINGTAKRDDYVVDLNDGAEGMHSTPTHDNEETLQQPGHVVSLKITDLETPPHLPYCCDTRPVSGCKPRILWLWCNPLPCRPGCIDHPPFQTQRAGSFNASDKSSGKAPPDIPLLTRDNEDALQQKQDIATDKSSEEYLPDIPLLTRDNEDKRQQDQDIAMVNITKDIEAAITEADTTSHLPYCCKGWPIPGCRHLERFCPWNGPCRRLCIDPPVPIEIISGSFNISNKSSGATRRDFPTRDNEVTLSSTRDIATIEDTQEIEASIVERQYTLPPPPPPYCCKVWNNRCVSVSSLCRVVVPCPPECIDHLHDPTDLLDASDDKPARNIEWDISSEREKTAPPPTL